MELALHLRRKQHQGSKRPGRPCLPDFDCPTPNNIPVLTLREIRVTLTFDDGEPTRKRPRLLAHRSSDPLQHLLELDETPEDIAVADAPETSRPSQFDPLSDGMFTPTPQTYRPKAVDFHPQENLLLLDEDMISPKRSRNSQKPAKRTVQDPADQYKAILSLIDTVFRRAIASRPHGLCRHIQYDLKHGPACLAEIAPSMFCPGYMQVSRTRSPCRD